MNDQDIDALDRSLADASPEEVVARAAELFGDTLVMTSSFGAHSACMIHLASKVVPHIKVVLVDTGYLFPETYQFADSLAARFPIELIVAAPEMSTAYFEARHGKLWEEGAEGVRSYLDMRKVEPLESCLRRLGAKAWLAGLRGGQTEHRAQLPRVMKQNERVKFHPILGFGEDDVLAYLKAHDLPLHPLVASGYRSIGDVHSTLPTTADMDPRAGRLLGQKQECGIHLALSEDVSKSLKSSGL